MRSILYLVALAAGADDEVGRLGELAVLVLDGLARLGGVQPAVVHDEEHVVVHDVVPVGHELLVHVVLIEQRHRLEPGEQVVADGGDEVVRLGVGVDARERVAVGGEPLGRQVAGVVGELLELGRVEDGLLHLADIEGQVAVAGAVRLEQLAAQLREGVPVAAEQRRGRGRGCRRAGGRRGPGGPRARRSRCSAGC